MNLHFSGRHFSRCRKQTLEDFKGLVHAHASPTIQSSPGSLLRHLTTLMYSVRCSTVLCVALPQEVMARPYVAAKMAEFEGHALPPDHHMDRNRLLALLDNR